MLKRLALAGSLALAAVPAHAACTLTNSYPFRDAGARMQAYASTVMADPDCRVVPWSMLVNGSGQPYAGAVGLPVAPATGAVFGVQPPVPAGIVTGQVSIAVTGTAVRLPTNPLANGLVIKARQTNAANGFVGPSGVTTAYDGTGTGYPVEPGAAASFATANSNAVYVNGTAGDVFSYEGN